MLDKFGDNVVGLDSPAEGAFDIYPSDEDELQNATRAIYVGGDGDLTVEMVNGDIATFVGCLAGVIYPFRVNRVYLSETTASNLIGLY